MLRMRRQTLPCAFQATGPSRAQQQAGGRQGQRQRQRLGQGWEAIREAARGGFSGERRWGTGAWGRCRGQGEKGRAAVMRGPMGHCLTSKGSSLIEQRQAQAQMQGVSLGRPGRWRGQKQGQHKRRVGQHKPQVQGRMQRRQWWGRQGSAIMGRTQAAASAAGTAGRTCLPSLASGERRCCCREGRRLAQAC